ncbi:MAG TPA: pyridine nucleotide-disulfide oxidoreductase [Candidatus Dietzia intestinipullorum]|nr:pyridine nucleotide-disulfide oxidoreductase [Candidatus Dietzia intestinipullorum]
MTWPSTSPLRIAVVGSGPAGVYACESLLNWADENEQEIVIDQFDALPVPFGLLRHGVAPDHPRIKGIANTLYAIGADPRIRFLGNVEFGTDIVLEDLRRHYHAAIFATGALADRSMRIPGEDLVGSHGAAEFVTWYDGHPDVDPEWDLSAERAAVVGVGNVALDVARMLVRTAEQLEATDIPEHVREGFHGTSAEVVSVIGRRGPAWAKFTTLELREMGKVEGLTVVVDPADLDDDEFSREHRESDRRAGQVFAQLEKWAAAMTENGHSSPDEAEESALAAGQKVLRFRFNRSPVEILGEDGRVVGLRLERTAPDGERLQMTGETEDLAVDAVYRAVGYRSAALADIPFDDATATIPNSAGRVLDSPGGEPIPGLFTAGWIKRGPSGVIGTNRSCAAETVRELLSDLEDGRLTAPESPDPQSVRDLLAERGVEAVDGRAWEAIDARERGLGEAGGRERTKLANREAMLAEGRSARTRS